MDPALNTHELGLGCHGETFKLGGTVRLQELPERRP